MDVNDIIKSLELKLKPSRFGHTMGVAYTAANLSMKYDIDMKKAYLAGLLHDCAKYMSDAEMLDYCNKHNIKLNSFEEQNTALLHSKIGAYMAKDEYGICDEAILNAIKYHTTGRINMTKLEEIVFIADYMEPNREMDPELPIIRKLAYSDITACIVKIYENTIRHLKKYDRPIDPTTLEAYEYYRGK